MLSKLLNFFRVKTVTSQPLTGEQKEVLDALETLILERAGSSSGGLSPKVVRISLMDQLRGRDHVMKVLSASLGTQNYIPRSIALVVDQLGTWNFVIGYRGEEAADDLTLTLFMHALSQTNAGRSV